MAGIYDLSDHPALEASVPRGGQLLALTETAEAQLGVNPLRVATEPREVSTIQLALAHQVNFLHAQGTLGRVLQSQGKTGANFRSTPSGAAPTVDPVAASVWARVPSQYKTPTYGEPGRITAGRGPL